ncbi:MULTISPECIES: (5-formylfuran-3-yl)methyl phosphate synthase [Methylotenera]|uniref:(5-formylfuran-3-yl)methyl phosphate synthase n=1 Tax=Methylotenera TaxID=359407 RepID=UPI000366D5C0|nr:MULTISPECIES: (5-formylfuran-3-yl)methyl phosphate synthase [Methylotenera]
MTQLLISVKNVEEALITLACGVDIIDLKDPNIGALGALDINTSREILQKIHQSKQLTRIQNLPFTSATVGESHANITELIKAVDARIKIGVDIIKISVSSLLSEVGSILDAELMANITSSKQVKFIAVFFADQPIDLTLLEKLKSHGFYGAMIDTHEKQKNLLEICTLSTLQMFTQICQKNDLKSGLAGSLKPQHVGALATISPSYIGFRGGVCTEGVRKSSLMQSKVVNVQAMLQEHNKIKVSV